MNSRIPFAIVIILTAPACSLFKKKETPAVLSDAPSHRPVMGTVVFVNAAARFVLVKSNRDLRAGTALYAKADTADPITLRVSTERRRPFLVAEILTGTPTTGMQLTE